MRREGVCRVRLFFWTGKFVYCVVIFVLRSFEVRQMILFYSPICILPNLNFRFTSFLHLNTEERGRVKFRQEEGTISDPSTARNRVVRKDVGGP